MNTARRYLAAEIYRTTVVVLLVLLGLFTFFEMIDELDRLNDKFSFMSLLYLQTLQFPTRLYDLLPIGLLIGAVIALAGLAQRNELVILRVSGISSYKLLRMLWVITIPIMLFSIFISEFATPYAEQKTSELSISLLSKNSNRMNSGYWFREPIGNAEYRVINIGYLNSHTRISNIAIFEYNNHNNQFVRLLQAPKGTLKENTLTLDDVTETNSLIHADSLQKGLVKPRDKIAERSVISKLTLKTTLTNKRLATTEQQPDRMSTLSLLDYVAYLKENNLQTNRHIVALWRKASYPFTILVMITLAAPIGSIQSRKGGMGAKIFLGMFIGIVFFMANQLALNVGMLNNLPPLLTALLPNIIALLLAFTALYYIERRTKPKSFIHVT